MVDGLTGPLTVDSTAATVVNRHRKGVLPDTHDHRSWLRTMALFLGLVLVAAACGGDDDSEAAFPGARDAERDEDVGGKGSILPST